MKLQDVVRYGQTVREIMIENNTVADPPKRYASNRKKKVCPHCDERIYLINLYAKFRPHWTVTKWITVGKWCPKCGMFFSQDQIDDLPDNDRFKKLMREWDETVSLLFEE